MTAMPRYRASIAVAIASLVLAAAPVGAQSVPPGSAARTASRGELETAAVTFDQLAASAAYGERTRSSARQQATEIRRRLTEGDFRPGDRLSLRIEGQLTVDDTLTVLADVRIAVPGFRQVSLVGVLRSELETKLRAELAEVVRSATVTARPLMRLAVLGSVARPGFFSVPSETTIDALLMLAGGPLGDASVNKMSITRADTLLLKASETQVALSEGRTVGELDLSDGDALVVPLRGSWDRASILQIVGLILTPLLTILVINR